ncbi:WG repeat-containing protein [Psychrobacter sp. FDAARGOS_221]|uniref:WG repeat-containing protein n=1 Tax=Psychrobacter sp. FDAARGOS_221 TaxID=1975705 RepID=UPI00187D6AB4|nr:WG repeat-containing protein [Psychrobacter sp. FDAARGOS_221]
MSVSHAYASNFGCQLNPGYELPEDIALNWLCSFNNEIAPAQHRLTQKYGAVNRQGEVVIPFDYESPVTFYDGKAWVQKGDKWVIINRDNQILGKFDIQQVYGFTRKGMALFQQNDKWGVMNIDGDVIIRPQFDDFVYSFGHGSFSQPDTAIVEIDGKQAAISEAGEIILPPKFDEIRQDNELLLVVNDDKMGVYDLQGNMQQPIEFEPISGISRDERWEDKYWLLLVDAKSGRIKMGAANKYGKTIVPVEFDDVDRIGENKYKVSKNGKYGIYGVNGLITPIHFDVISDTQQGPTLIKYQGQWGYLKDFNSLLLVDYDVVDEFSEGLAAVANYQHKPDNNDSGAAQTTLSWGYINTLGKEVIPLQYQSAKPFKDGLAAVKNNDKWGVINFENKQIAPFEYDAISGFKQGYAVVGNYLPDVMVVDDISDFYRLDEPSSEQASDGSAAEAEAEAENDVINGTQALASDAIYGIEDMTSRESLPMRFGLLSNQGSLVFPATYQNITRASEGMIAVKKNDQWGFANQQGDLIFDYQFDQIFPPFEQGEMQVDNCYDDAGNRLYCHADEVNIKSLHINKQGDIIYGLSSEMSYATEEAAE